MAKTQTQQVKDAINQADAVLITFAKNYTVDALASSLAFFSLLTKLGKKVTVACDEFKLQSNHKFLDNSELVRSSIGNVQQFIIELDIAGKSIDEFSYDVVDEALKIYITPKNGSFKQELVTTKQSDYKYDLIIVLDTADLASLGAVFTDNSEFFYNVSILNIDHKPSNEQYGQYNLIDVNTTSTAEVVYSFFKELNGNHMTPQIATSLLAGLIAKTKSFKTPNVTPKTLKTASELIAADADRQLIVQQLYRSRSLSTMRIWGLVLSRLKSSMENRLTWSVLTEQDIIKANASAEDLPDVIDELISFIPGVEVVVLLYQKDSTTSVLVRSLKNYDSVHITNSFKARGDRALATFDLVDHNLVQAEKKVIPELEKFISSQ